MEGDYLPERGASVVEVLTLLAGFGKVLFALTDEDTMVLDPNDEVEIV